MRVHVFNPGCRADLAPGPPVGIPRGMPFLLDDDGAPVHLVNDRLRSQRSPQRFVLGSSNSSSYDLSLLKIEVLWDSDRARAWPLPGVASMSVRLTKRSMSLLRALQLMDGEGGSTEHPVESCSARMRKLNSTVMRGSVPP